MKTIAHYFTSPKTISENSNEHISNNKKQTSVKCLFEKSNSNGSKIVKPSKKGLENDVLNEKLKSCKKLEFNSEEKSDKSNVSNAVKKCSNAHVEDEGNMRKRKKSANNVDSKSKTKSTLAKRNQNINSVCVEDENSHSKNSKKRKNSVNDDVVPHSKKKKTSDVELGANVPINEENFSSKHNKVLNVKENELKLKMVNNISKSRDKHRKSKQIKEKLISSESLANLDSNTKSNTKEAVRNNISYSKKKVLKGNSKINTDSDSDSSIEVFGTKQTKKKRKSSVAKTECKSSPDVEPDTKVSPNNSLFSYFSKVDKLDTSLTPSEYPKIKVQALVHFPPDKEPRRSIHRKSTEFLNNSKNQHKIKALMKTSDKIDILSSEIIELSNSSSVLEPVSCDENVIVTDKTPDKTNSIESYFRFSSSKSSTNKENTEESLQKKGSGCKPWAMRVKIAPQPMNASVSDKEFISEANETRKKTNIDEPTIIIDDESNENVQPPEKNTGLKNCEMKQSVKMFSLFLKDDKIRQQNEDREKLEAKAKFLVSGAPELVKRKIDFLKSESCIGSPAKYPRITHVQQLDYRDDIWNLKTPKLPLTLPIPQWDAETLSSFPLSQDTCAESRLTAVLKPPENIKKYLEEFTNQDTETAADKLYKSLRSKKKKLGNSCDIWTDLYKPETISEILGNSGNKNKLKKWLQEQKSLRRRGGSVSSGDEFINSDSDGEDKPRNNVAVLVGPYGCGKTCSVYAIAQELGCEVLEINASCNRNGKRLLTEFSEFTQSHNVDLSQSLLTPGASKKLKKKKKLKLLSNETTSGKTSVLLVEDADILFTNHDEGFVTAITALISSSKRPVILTVNDHKCPHLSKFDSSNQLKLTFNRPRLSQLATWLRVIALVEGVAVSQQQVEGLVEQCSGDVRQCLLQLQLIVQSNFAQSKTNCTMASLWWTWPAKYDLNFELPTLESSKNEEEEENNEIDKEKMKKDIKSIANLTSRLVCLDMMSSNVQQKSADSIYPDLWKACTVEATYLSDKEAAKEVSNSLNLELSDWLGKHVINSGNHQHFTTSAENRWCRILKKAHDVFTPAISLSQHCSHHATSADYLPWLRTIGRAERFRLATHSKRANRYFSYLKGLGIHANQFLKDFMNECFIEV